MLNFDISNKHIANVMQDAVFLDIETSLVNARVFKPGTQYIAAHQLNSETRILTVAGGTLYDLYTKGNQGMFGFGNHMADTFADNPLDDTFVLRRIWDILDKAKVIIAHNARFDTGWINGRFLELGWPLPSRCKVVCTYQMLNKINLTSKKLDQLSKTLIGTRKLPTNFDLWDRCSNGEVAAFKEMMEYNKGDIADTLYEVYMKIAPYSPDKAIDMINYEAGDVFCKVDGSPLEYLEDMYVNRNTGKLHQLYFNPILGITYVDKKHEEHELAGTGLIKHFI